MINWYLWCTIYRLLVAIYELPWPTKYDYIRLLEIHCFLNRLFLNKLSGVIVPLVAFSIIIDQYNISVVIDFEATALAL